MLSLIHIFGHLFHRRRVLMSVVAFFALNIAENLAISLASNLGIMELFDQILSFSGHAGFWVGIVLMLIPSVVMFLTTSYILKNRLNLE